jgi:hypothetical protein
MERIKAWLADFPTTSARIVFTLGVVAGTALVAFYCFARGTHLDEENWEAWLIFLAVMSGIDAAQWTMKRQTAWEPPRTASEMPATAGTESVVPTGTTAAATLPAGTVKVAAPFTAYDPGA